MKTFIIPLVTIIVISLLCFGCSELSPLDSESVYPTTLSAVSDARLQELQNEFDKTNNYEISSKLNSYGYIGNDGVAFSPEWQAVELSEGEAKQIGIKTLLRNKKFTNTMSEREILSREMKIDKLYRNNNNWKIKLGIQKIKGFEVIGSVISLMISGGKVYKIWGSWYPDVYIPDHDKINQSEAKSGIIGIEIEIRGFYPHNSVFVVTDSSVGEMNKVIFPLEKDNSLELRVAWQISIKFAGSTCWYIYLDTTTSEILGTEQLIIFN